MTKGAAQRMHCVACEQPFEWSQPPLAFTATVCATCGTVQHVSEDVKKMEVMTDDVLETYEQEDLNTLADLAKSVDAEIAARTLH
jgi:NAD-dependent SIR2 family protein deacetylase